VWRGSSKQNQISKLVQTETLIIGLDNDGVAACEALRREGVGVTALDEGNSEALRQKADYLRTLGVRVQLGATAPPAEEFRRAVLSRSVPLESKIVRALRQNGVPIVTELEFGLEETRCLTIAVTGANGKSTTASLIERILGHNSRRTLVCGDQARPVCSIVEQTRNLDFLVLHAEPFQLQRAEFFRASVAVLLNVLPMHAAEYSAFEQSVRACAQVFRHQQFYDWAIIQSEALVRLREFGLALQSKTITFSASDSSADLFLDRGLLTSRLPNWSGPLLDLDHCLLRGPHNAENLMAALAVGHALRLPLGGMVDALKTFHAGPHRCELVAEINGVQYVNDSKACNVNAMEHALLAARPGPNGEPNVWLIAGGKDERQEFHGSGPLLSKRVKGVFLIGEASETIRSAWSLFTPCMQATSLLEAVAEAARSATSGDVILFSPACSGLDQFRNYQHRGQSFCEAVKSIGRGDATRSPYIHGRSAAAWG